MLSRDLGPDVTEKISESLYGDQLSTQTTKEPSLTGMRARVERFTQ